MAVVKGKKFTLVRGNTYIAGGVIFTKGVTNFVEDKKTAEYLPKVVDAKGRRRFQEGDVANAVLATEVVPAPVVPTTLEEYKTLLDAAHVVYPPDADADELADLCRKLGEADKGSDDSGDERI